MISQCKICTTHGGLAIYLSDKYNYALLSLHKYSEIWESQFIEVSGNKSPKKVVLGNVYRPPRHINENYCTFIDEFTIILKSFQKSKCDVVIAGDYNINLLKINEKPLFCEYLDNVLAQGFYPVITLPTIFSVRNCTLLDNLLCNLSGNPDNYSTGILTNCISDHQPYFIILDLIHIHKYVPKFIKSNSYDLNSIINFKRAIVSSNIIQKLISDRISDPNDNYNTLDNVIQRCKNAYLPTKIKKYT